MSKEKIDFYENQIEDLKDKISDLEDINLKLSNDLDEVEAEREDIEEQFDELREKIDCNYLLNIYPRNLANESFIEDLQDYINKKGIKDIKKLIDNEREFEKDFWSK